MQPIDAERTMPPPPPALIRLSIRADYRLLPPVCALVRETARQAGLEDSAARYLELLSEELCLVVIKQAFENRNDQTFDLEIGLRPDAFVLTVEDRGQPFDLDDAGRSGLTDIEVQMLKGLSDDIEVENLGKKGLRLRLAKYLKPLQPIGVAALALEQSVDSETETPRSTTPVDLRDMQPGDALAFSRCMHNTYGLTYRDVVYFPERIVDRLLSGELYSRVAVTAQGEIVAHHGLARHAGTGPVAEFTMGVVDPRFRGRGLFETLKAESIDRVAARGIRGLYAECVALHPFSQQANYTMGARETGFMLNNVSGARNFRGIGGGAEQRGHIAWMYLKIADHPERTIYPPAAHAEMIDRICRNAGLPRRSATGLPGLPGLPVERTVLRIEPDTDGGLAVLSVLRIGHDLKTEVDLARERLAPHAAVLYLDLPLGDPATPTACAALEARGWSFALIAPEYAENGDMLRLQWLNSPVPTAGQIATVSPFGTELCRYVAAAAQAVAAPDCIAVA